MLLTVYGTEWPLLCWCTVKKLLSHSRTTLAPNPGNDTDLIKSSSTDAAMVEN